MLLAARVLIAPRGDLTKDVVLGPNQGTMTDFLNLVEEWYVRASLKFPEEPQRIAWAYYLAYTFVADRLAAAYASESANNTYSRSISMEQVNYFRNKAAQKKLEAVSGLQKQMTSMTVGIPTKVTL